MRRGRRSALLTLVAAGLAPAAAAPALEPSDVVKHPDAAPADSRRPPHYYNIRALEPTDVVKVAPSSGDAVKQARLGPGDVVKHLDSPATPCGTSRYSIPDVAPNPERGVDCDEAIEAIIDSGQSLGCRPGSYSEVGEDWVVESQGARCVWYELIRGERGRKYQEFAFYVAYK